MPLANSFCLAQMRYADGLRITDVRYVGPTGRQNVFLRKLGEAIDLEKVDFKEYVRSARQGHIWSLFVEGLLSSIQVEISERVESELIKAARDLQMPSPFDNSIYAQENVSTVELEPGVTVAVVGKANNPPAPVPQAVEVPRAVEIEPGITAPGKMVEDGVAEEAHPEPIPEKKEQQELKGEFDDWKTNKDFQSQKREILGSSDQKFLAWVSASESKQFQKLARTRLAELGG